MPLPDLENRFLPPDGWTEDYFENPQTGHKIRYGFSLHPNPVSCVVLLGGLSEFSEKYFETMRDLLSRDLSVFTMDWAYQGLSTRSASNPHKRSSDGYDQDIADLNYFIRNYVLKNSGDLPLIMAAHSMGGHIGLRYLAEHPDVFSATALSAPMAGIKQLQAFGMSVKAMLLFLRPFHDSYVPGGADWHEAMRKSDGNDIFSSDPIRDHIHNFWCLHNPDLQVGGPTLGWLWESITSIHKVDSDALSKIKIPTLLAAAGDEKIVDNGAIREIADNLAQATYLEIEGAKHEILMEKDEYRAQFFKAFDELLKQVKVTP